MGLEAGRAGGDTRTEVLKQMVRFGVVGCTNTALSWGAYALLVAAGMDVLLASGGAWSLGAGHSYALHRRWTFRSRGRYAPELVRFVAVQCAGLALDLVLLAALTRDAGVYELVAPDPVHRTLGW